MNPKLEKKIMNQIKKKVLRKQIQKRISKGQILPVPALASAGLLIAAGFTVVPVAAAVAGWQIHKAVKKYKAAEAPPLEKGLPDLTKPPQQELPQPAPEPNEGKKSRT